MSEYIKRDDVVKLVAKILAAEAQFQGYDVDVSDCLSEAAAWVRAYCPEIDLVRCKECKHCYVDGEQVKFNACELNHNKVQSDDWYCADGEREGE